ncbi:hypothetical protein PR048_005883 [Dryococelus australis]|uniref:Uncharacterized protein n=1 Tax=Dryococelus australis TaxID=614101 RepID=A0ABQ9I9G5_9NEOP|nr:hypothetical protein PR048_005883 [Dryococelus australis]
MPIASSAVDSSPVTSNSSSTPSVASYFSATEVMDAEIRSALKCIDSHYSLNSCEGLSELFKNMFPDSSIVKQFSCSATKCAYIIYFELAPYFIVAIFKCANIHINWDSNSNEVTTRYFTSVFMGHSSEEVTLSVLREATEKLNVSKLLNLSMDGPTVNWKLFSVLQVDWKNDFGCTLIDVGSSTLHTLNNCFKHGNLSTSWDLEGFLASIYWLFKDFPARKEDY